MVDQFKQAIYCVLYSTIFHFANWQCLIMACRCLTFPTPCSTSCGPRSTIFHYRPLQFNFMIEYCTDVCVITGNRGLLYSRYCSYPKAFPTPGNLIETMNLKILCPQLQEAILKKCPHHLFQCQDLFLCLQKNMPRWLLLKTLN